MKTAVKTSVSGEWPLPPFAGFELDAFAFFRELAGAQDKYWMAANKARYTTVVQEPMRSLVADLTIALGKAKIPLRGDPMKSVFRLNRDVRFSKDKSPYKTNASFALTREASKTAPGVLYFHLDPTGSFAAAGFFMPEPPVLTKFRTAIADDPAGWNAIEARLITAGLPLQRDETLARPPKGYEHAPAEVADTLKLKSFVVKHNLATGDLGSAALISQLVSLAKTASPLLNFDWEAIDP